MPDQIGLRRTTAGSQPAVLGFRPHTYWTAVVVLGGSADQPVMIERRRIEFATGYERFVFHQAAEGELAGAAGMIDKVRETTRVNASREMTTLLATLQNQGVQTGPAIVPTGGVKLPGDLSDILKTHSRIHAAEGEFYRDVVASACETVGLEVRREVERELTALLCARLEIDRLSLEARLKQMGAALGPPWSEDQRLATTAAWLHL